jgi:hypothetical protein
VAAATVPGPGGRRPTRGGRRADEGDEPGAAVDDGVRRFGQAGIRVNPVCPGLLPTELSESAGEIEEPRPDFAAQMRLGTGGTSAARCFRAGWRIS